eukprot:7133324-Pyramimonas_sp.AAC.1
MGSVDLLGGGPSTLGGARQRDPDRCGEALVRPVKGVGYVIASWPPTSGPRCRIPRRCGLLQADAKQL